MKGMPHAAECSGTLSLAEGNRSHGLYLQADPRISERRIVWTRFPTVASNIAEGRGRLNQREFRQFLGVALGSIFEVKTQLVVARRLEMGNERDIDEAASLSEEVSKMLTSLINKLGERS
jgi:hypothetical protein